MALLRVKSQVKTPLGFFVLVVLIFESIFGLVATTSVPGERMLILGGMMFVMVLLIGIVTYLAIRTPEALSGARATVTTNKLAMSDLYQARIATP